MKTLIVKKRKTDKGSYIVSTDHIVENYDIVGQDEEGVILLKPKGQSKKLTIKKEN